MWSESGWGPAFKRMFARPPQPTSGRPLSAGRLLEETAETHPTDWRRLGPKGWRDGFFRTCNEGNLRCGVLAPLPHMRSSFRALPFAPGGFACLIHRRCMPKNTPDTSLPLGGRCRKCFSRWMCSVRVSSCSLYERAGRACSDIYAERPGRGLNITEHPRSNGLVAPGQRRSRVRMWDGRGLGAGRQDMCERRITPNDSDNRKTASACTTCRTSCRCGPPPTVAETPAEAHATLLRCGYGSVNGGCQPPACKLPMLVMASRCWAGQ